MNKLALILPFLGKLPSYWPLFAHTASFYPEIDFYLICDQPGDSKRYPNIHFRELTVDSFNRRAQKALGLDLKIMPQYAYKLCDWKPLYGLLFKDVIEKYSHWGYCDIDLILGNIHDTLTPAALERYDYMTLHPLYCSGAFSVYKNSNRMVHFFEQSADWQSILKDHLKVYSFSEAGPKNWQRVLSGMPIEQIEGPESLTHLVKRETAKGNIQSYFGPHILELIKPNQIYRWAPRSFGFAESSEPCSHNVFHWVLHKNFSRFYFKSMPEPKELFISQYGFFSTLSEAKSLLNKGIRTVRAAVRALPRRTRGLFR